MRKRKPLAERLWNMVDIKEPAECWLWTGGKAGNGYGTIRKWANNRWVSAYAHREVLYLTVGDPSANAPQALHSCDTPACCNPNHLSWGSNSQNRRQARDRLNNQGNQKLTLNDVKSIRQDQRKYAEIAESHYVHLSTISRIKTARGWLT